MYGIFLDENSRVVGAYPLEICMPEAIPVQSLPEGDYLDYLYLDGKFVYLPIEEEEDPTPANDISTLEKNIAELTKQISHLTELLEKQEVK